MGGHCCQAGVCHRPWPSVHRHQADQASFQHYTGGILSSGCGTNLDHGVLAVGYNTAENYWLVKNSWGASWGDAGYIKISSASDVCGVLKQPVYPQVSASVAV